MRRRASREMERRAFAEVKGACADRAFGGFRAVAMCRRLTAQRMRFVYQGIQFFLGQLRRIDVVR